MNGWSGLEIVDYNYEEVLRQSGKSLKSGGSLCAEVFRARIARWRKAHVTVYQVSTPIPQVRALSHEPIVHTHEPVIHTNTDSRGP